MTSPLFPKPAATLPGEADILARVLADQSDDAAKLVYADWLQDRDDPRGEFLRTFLAAKNTGAKKLPSSRAVPKVWRQLVGVTLVEEIQKAGLSEWMQGILAVARPALAISTKSVRFDGVPEGQSKFGGRPYLPRDVVWPQSGNRPLGFLGQINLSELAGAMAAREMPATGMLSFFGLAEVEVHSGSAVGEGCEWRLLYTPNHYGLVRRMSPAALGRHDDYSECRLTFSETLDLPEWYSKAIQALGIPEHLSDAYSDLVRTLRPSPHHLLGHPWSGVAAYDVLPGPEWMHFCTLGRDQNVRWGWNDHPYLAWFLPQDDLRQKQFENIRIESI